MRVLVVADVHSNLAALEAVVADASVGGGFDAVWALGDLVGYGPDPVECLALLRSYPLVAIAGNHDMAAVGTLDVAEFNPVAAAAIEWTTGRLGEDERAFLRSLAPARVEGEFTLVHGSLVDPVWEYLLSSRAAAEHFERQTTQFALVGHSHFPVVFYEGWSAGEDTEVLADGDVVPLGTGRWVANPGGLGQPRDGDPRPPYALLDTAARTLSFHRVEYDFTRTQAAMAAAGLPEALIERLAFGR
jgi:predicted phosphodiesterase